MFMQARPEEELTLAPEDASSGAPLSFLDSVKRAYAYDKLVESQYGLAQAMIEQEQETFEDIKRAGGTPPRSAFLSDEWDRDYLFGAGNLAKADRAAKAVRDGDRRTYDDMFKARDEELRDFKIRFPLANIKTYAEMYGDVRDNLNYMTELQKKQGSAVGSFVGGMGAAFNPAVNPLNVATLPVGGFGKSAINRILTESLAQGGIQGIEELLGVRENKRLLGIEPTLGDSLLNVGAAAGFGGAAQGLGEVVRMGAKAVRGRWFRNTPDDPAPLPPEPVQVPTTPAVEVPQRSGMSVTRNIDTDTELSIMRAVREVAGSDSRNFRRSVMADYNNVAIQLEQWSGPRPWEIAPPMYTRALPSKMDIEAPAVTPKTAGATLDEIARQVDPVTFKQWDELQAQVAQTRKLVTQAVGDKNVDARAELQQFDDEIAAKTASLRGATKKQRAKIEADIADLKEARTARESGLLNMSPNNAADYRAELMRMDEKLRDLAPAVSRAYSRAKGKWNDDELLRADIQRMMNEGDTAISPDVYGPQKPDVLTRAEMEFDKQTIADIVPELASTPKQAGEDALDALKRFNEGAAKLAEKALDELQAIIPKLSKAEGEEAIMSFEGIGDVPLSRELIIDVDGDGKNIRKMTAREYLESILEDEEALQAVMTCTVGSASKTV